MKLTHGIIASTLKQAYEQVIGLTEGETIIFLFINENVELGLIGFLIGQFEC